MKKLSIYIIIIFFLVSSIVYSGEKDTKTKKDKTKKTILKKDGKKEKEPQLVKRKVAIVTLFNSSKDPEYDYLTTTISDALRGDLDKTGFYDIMDSAKVEKKLADKKISTKKFVWENDAINIGTYLKVDVVIYGFFSVEENKITVYMNALDVAVRKSAINLEMSSAGLGMKVIKLANEISKEMAVKMKKELPAFKEKVKLTNAKIAGIVNNVVGSTFLLTGFALLGASLGYDYYLENNSGNYDDYVRGKTLAQGLFYGSMASLGTGAVMITVSIPLFLFKKKERH